MNEEPFKDWTLIPREPAQINDLNRPTSIKINGVTHAIVQDDSAEQYQLHKFKNGQCVWLEMPSF